jgi:hypothetical protein
VILVRSTIFWNMIPMTSCCLLLFGYLFSLPFNPKSRSSMFLRNVVELLPATHPRSKQKYTSPIPFYLTKTRLYAFLNLGTTMNVKWGGDTCLIVRFIFWKQVSNFDWLPMLNGWSLVATAGCILDLRLDGNVAINIRGKSTGGGPPAQGFGGGANHPSNSTVLTL